MTKKRKLNFSILSICLALTCLLTYCLTNYFQAKHISTQAVVRTIDATPNEIDYQSIFAEFEDAKLETQGTITTFEGTKPISLKDLAELDNLSESDIATCESISVTYHFSYDSQTNLVTLSAETKNGEHIVEVEEIQGIAFQNELGNIDALLDVDGEYILLSEMQDMGMIQNCGWFKKLWKRVVVATVVVVAVAAVAAVTVATCGAGLGACIAAGAAAGAVAGGVAGGLISYSEYGKLDWRWIVGGAVIGGALGAVTGWGVGSAMGAGGATAGASGTTTKSTQSVIDAAKNGKLDFSNSIKNKSYFQKGSSDYRSYYEQANTISHEIMKAKNPVVESGTNYLKWTVEGAKNSTKGVWELVIDPAKKTIVHFLFRT